MLRIRISSISQCVSQRRFGISCLSRSYSAKEVEFDIRQQLRNIKDPITQQNIVSLGLVNQISIQNNDLYIELNSFLPGYTYKVDIEQQCKSAINKFFSGIVERVIVSTNNNDIIKANRLGNMSSTISLKSVKHAIAVSSCKGGVGKSTIAVNLALSLAKQNLKVGILDADIYGPSLPSMLRPIDPTVKRSKTKEKFVEPLTGPLNIKMLSFGHVNPKAGAPGAGGKEAALIRGPIASRVINQLICFTDWDELDYLIVDMPPGTGDVNLTICQTISFSGAVIVTTPQVLSMVDCIKGIEMFQQLNVPILSIVENMSYFKCDLGKVYYPFGRGGIEKLVKGFNSERSSEISHVPFTSLPLDSIQSIDSERIYSDRNVTNDNPYIIDNPKSDIAMKYQDLADSMISEMIRVYTASQLTPLIKYDESRGIILRYFTTLSAVEFIISPAELRIRDPATGKILEGEDIRKYTSSYPTRFEIKGNYGVAIQWNDGHFADIFPYGILKLIAEELLEKQHIQ